MSPRPRSRPEPLPSEPSFTDALFAFLDDLRANNDKAWFAANRARYDADVLEPALVFIEDFAPRLEGISRHFRADARASGGSLFRIHRDTRFSKDKTPYKTNIGIHFRHTSAKDAHAPGFYLHLERGAVFAGAGIWRPDGPTTQRIREAIVEDPDGWLAATRSPEFAARLHLDGDRLKRPPTGFDPAHPLVDDLRWKDFIGLAPLTDAAACGDGFIDDYEAICHAAAPLASFLCRALGLPF
jgi:uncharacterized protein (TIGR02453 family)